MGVSENMIGIIIGVIAIISVGAFIYVQYKKKNDDGRVKLKIAPEYWDGIKKAWDELQEKKSKDAKELTPEEAKKEDYRGD